MTKQESRTPFAEWLIKECKRTIDLRTGKPITWRQASLQAGLDHSAISRFIHGTQPSTDSIYHLAIFFSTAERQINPDYLLHIANLRFDPRAPEIIPPKTEPPRPTDEQADAIFRAVLGDELNDMLAEIIEEPGGIEDLTDLLRGWLRRRQK
jgi:transcriptional regulator with XRE-family HTH domain